MSIITDQATFTKLQTNGMEQQYGPCIPEVESPTVHGINWQMHFHQAVLGYAASEPEGS